MRIHEEGRISISAPIERSMKRAQTDFRFGDNLKRLRVDAGRSVAAEVKVNLALFDDRRWGCVAVYVVAQRVRFGILE